MNEKILKDFIAEIKNITNNEFQLIESKIKNKNNYFLSRIELIPNFKMLTLQKIHRLYNTYKEDNYQKNIILNNIKKLFTNNWDGAYSELTTYDLLNFVLNEPCKIQINDIKKENTLAKYCVNSEVSEIDGFNEDIVSFFEIKTLRNNLNDLMYKIKQELQSFNKNDYFVIQSDYPTCIEIKDNNSYAKLKNEIAIARKTKKNYLSSKAIKGLNLKFYYEPQSVLIESHTCENPFEMAKRLETLPIKNYSQFVDGRFIKIFVCNALNINNSIIENRDFFRALARRVFCKLTKEEQVFDEDSGLTRAFIAKKLSGLLFIVDLSSTDKIFDDFSKAYKVYAYSNPNADFKNRFIGFRNLVYSLNIKGIKTDFDDFEADNY